MQAPEVTPRDLFTVEQFSERRPAWSHYATSYLTPQTARIRGANAFPAMDLPRRAASFAWGAVC